MRRGVKCKKEVINLLKSEYDRILKEEYGGDYLKALRDFEYISENRLRALLSRFYGKPKSASGAWRPCKGELYEYVILNFIKNIIEKDKELKKRLEAVPGEQILSYKNQIAIKNWSEVYPDVDILLVDKSKGLVKSIISCKTSLRERLTETAFWKRELEKEGKSQDIKFVFITTNKDKELQLDTNRYIIQHIIDYTFVTDSVKYEELLRAYKKRYGTRKDFNELISKVKDIEDFKQFLKELVTH